MSALLEARTRIPSQRDTIVDLLLERGDLGATNSELSKIALVYQTRIFELTEEGYVFKLDNLGQGLIRYTLVSAPTTPAPPRKAVKDVVIEDINENYGGLMDVSSLQEMLANCNATVSRKSVAKIIKGGNK
jgi:hypothetical protein